MRGDGGCEEWRLWWMLVVVKDGVVWYNDSCKIRDCEGCGCCEKWGL